MFWPDKMVSLTVAELLLFLFSGFCDEDKMDPKDPQTAEGETLVESFEQMSSTTSAEPSFKKSARKGERTII